MYYSASSDEPMFAAENFFHDHDAVFSPSVLVRDFPTIWALPHCVGLGEFFVFSKVFPFHLSFTSFFPASPFHGEVLWGEVLPLVLRGVETPQTLCLPRTGRATVRKASWFFWFPVFLDTIISQDSKDVKLNVLI